MCGDVSIEVIEIRDQEARLARLGEHQQARIEHIAIEVDDLEATLRALEALAVRPKAPPRLSGGRLTFWTEPQSSDGVMYQFVEKEATTQAEQTES
jgi:methylmalonyl-CoA/ethylmalonyl-CoA epimerase